MKRIQGHTGRGENPCCSKKEEVQVQEADTVTLNHVSRNGSENIGVVFSKQLILSADSSLRVTSVVNQLST